MWIGHFAIYFYDEALKYKPYIKEKIGPKVVDLYAGLGDYLLKDGMPEDAISVYKKALRYSSDKNKKKEIGNKLADCCMRAGDQFLKMGLDRPAINDYKEALKYAPPEKKADIQKKIHKLEK